MIVTTDADGWARIRLRDFPNATFELEEQERYNDEELEPGERLVTYSLTLLFPDENGVVHTPSASDGRFEASLREIAEAFRESQRTQGRAS